MTMTTSPAAASMPAVIAIWWPKLRDSSISSKRGSPAAMPRRKMTLVSRLPSSTKMASALASSMSSRLVIRRTKSGSTASSLKIGMTRE